MNRRVRKFISALSLQMVVYWELYSFFFLRAGNCILLLLSCGMPYAYAVLLRCAFHLLYNMLVVFPKQSNT